MTLNVGLGLALVCAALTQLGFLCKHRGCNAIAPIELWRPLHSARALLRSPWFAIGMAVTVAAWLMHVAALALAPLSTVQVVLSTGVVMLAVMGACLFGSEVSSREWLGVGMTTAGLVVLVVTLPSHQGSQASFTWPVLALFEGGMLAIGALLIVSPRLGAPSHHHGALLGAVAGTLFGVSDVAVKALSGLAPEGPLAVVGSPWLIVAGCAAVLAFLASARGLQQGNAVPVIASMSTAANVTCIVGGIAVFGDALASQAMLFIVQVVAFALVAVAALLTPAGHGRPSVAAA